IQNDQRQVAIEIKQAHLELEKLLKQLKRGARKDFTKLMESTIEHVFQCSNKGTGWLEMANHVQNFYERMSYRLSNDKSYKGVSAELSEFLMDRAEKYMLVKIYFCIFCPPSTDDLQKDQTIFKKMKNLHWIEPRHLDVPINEQEPQVCSLLDQAIAEIMKINTVKAPQDKLSIFLQFHKSIVEMVQVSESRLPNTDDLVSLLVYVLLKANPPYLKSNVQYIIRFANPTRLGIGESAYCFTNMVCAVIFIESMTVTSLSLTTQEYDKYVSGEAVFPHAANTFQPVDLSLKYGNLKTLAEFQQRHDKVMSETLRLHQDIKEFKDNFIQEMEKVLSRTPPKIQLMQMDAETGSNTYSEELPPCISLEAVVSLTLSLPPGRFVQNDVESVTVTEVPSIVPGNNMRNDVEYVDVTEVPSILPDSSVQNNVESVEVTEAPSIIPDSSLQNDAESVDVTEAPSIVPDSSVQNDAETVDVTEAPSIVPDSSVQNDAESVDVTEAPSIVPDSSVQNDVQTFNDLTNALYLFIYLFIYLFAFRNWLL
ncbi:hypothetical protein ACJMK2_032865, partial [Sinanodonta woodiana]